MEKILEFETGREWHFDTGTVWVGFLITAEPEEIQKPNECIECGKWFKKGEKGHSVCEQYVLHEVEGHEVVEPRIGFLCQECFRKAQSEGNFRGGKLRGRDPIRPDHLGRQRKGKK
jgi:hypothetical protein